MKWISLCKKLFPFAFRICNLHRFLWTILILSAAFALSLLGGTLLVGLQTVGLIAGVVFFVAALYAALAIALSCLSFLDVIEQ